MDQFSQMIINTVDKVKDAVVKIDIWKTVRGKLKQAGSGSGFVFSSDGFAFTNSHVIHNADKIQVTKMGGDEWQERADFILSELIHAVRRPNKNSNYWIVNGAGMQTADLMTGNGGILHLLLKYRSPERTSFL